MRPFTYARADTLDAAITGGKGNAAAFLAGGTTLLDLMKLDVVRPQTVVDINPLADSLSRIEVSATGLRLGALARMADVADHPSVRNDYPVLAQSLDLAASAQIRNMATLGGNVLQRTRCTYFRDPSWRACNKREPGSGCAALEGVNRKHAVLGVSDRCIATYAGDFAQALMVLDAAIDLNGPDGPRTIPFAELHKIPGDTPDQETTLRRGELITGFNVAKTPPTSRSLYLKVRDRESYEFALASAAVVLGLRENKVNDVRIALGGVATKPWRAHAAEEALRGQEVTEKSAMAAAKLAFAEARSHSGNAYKIDLGQRTLVQALLQVAEI